MGNNFPLNYHTGELDSAMRIVEEEGYSEASHGERMAVAVELVKISALRDIANRLRHIEQSIHDKT